MVVVRNVLKFKQFKGLPLKQEYTNSDQPQDFCGVVGVYGTPEASVWTYLGLFALQHRGQESTGIACSNGSRIVKHLGMGLVSDVFNDDILRELPGHIAIGHNRYSTTGSSNKQNIGPIIVNHKLGTIGVAHNGNLVNSSQLRHLLSVDKHQLKTKFLMLVNR